MDYFVRRVKELEEEISLEQNSNIVKIKAGYLVAAKEQLAAIIQAKVQSEIKMTEAAHEAKVQSEMAAHEAKVQSEIRMTEAAHEAKVQSEIRMTEAAHEADLEIKKRKAEVELAILSGK